MSEYLPCSASARRRLLKMPMPSLKPNRTLKIEETGDYFHRKTKPQIRLKGKWLAALGFKPGQRVEIRSFSFQPGQLLLVAHDLENPA